MRQSNCLFFILLQLGIASAFADPAPVDESGWLKTMALAAHQTDYSGVFVYQSGGRVEMSRITHVADAAGEHERLEGIDGERRELIRDNDQAWLSVDGHKVRLVNHQIKRSFPALLPEQISLLKQNYSVTQAEEDEASHGDTSWRQIDRFTPRRKRHGNRSSRYERQEGGCDEQPSGNSEEKSATHRHAALDMCHFPVLAG